MQPQDAIDPWADEGRAAFIVWLSYQRRSEVLAPLIGRAEPVYFPHYFIRPALRPFDYLFKLVRTIIYLHQSKPAYTVLQAPPIFAALAAILTKTPYVVDVHNGLVQSFWSQIPLTQLCLNRAIALIVHNSEIASALLVRVPSANVVVIQDPIQHISVRGRAREKGRILFICSFDRDEPVELILKVIRALPSYQFTITANLQRLSPELRNSYQQCPNLLLTGFLKTDDYHVLLTSSQAAVVLSTMPSVQPSGAVEALSSDTPLVVTRTTLTEVLFGEWAVLCDNSLDSVITAIQSIGDEALDLTEYRSRWNENVANGVAVLKQLVQRDIAHRSSR